MIVGQNSITKTEEKVVSVQTENEVIETLEKIEKNEEVIFIRRQFQPPSQLEIRFVRLKKALRKRSVSII